MRKPANLPTCLLEMWLRIVYFRYEPYEKLLKAYEHFMSDEDNLLTDDFKRYYEMFLVSPTLLNFRRCKLTMDTLITWFGIAYPE